MTSLSPSLVPLCCSLFYSFFVSIFLSLPLNVHVVAGIPQRDAAGYKYGQVVPVSCLNRTIESGEHIIDDLGKLQYIPFPTCNETLHPLAFRYGVSETVVCTISSLPDELYHLLEYYVHSDVPLVCRVPTSSLLPSVDIGESPIRPDRKSDGNQENKDESAIIQDGPSYTPLTIALQGTLQRSHLHIWTDMNVPLHKFSSAMSLKKWKATTAPGYIVAGAAYSLPELDAPPDTKEGEKEISKEETEAVLLENAKNPWTPGHGSKVIRGEPLTFRFRVRWIEGGESLGWTTPLTSRNPPSEKGILIEKLLLFAFAAGVGALAALLWERNHASRRRGGWNADGILGRPFQGRSNSGVTYGDGGRMNGYGGYSQGSGSYGSYGGYSGDKKD